MLTELTQAVRDEIDAGTDWIAEQTRRGARGGALIGAVVGSMLSAVLLGLGIIIGKVW